MISSRTIARLANVKKLTSPADTTKGMDKHSMAYAHEQEIYNERRNMHEAIFNAIRQILIEDMMEELNETLGDKA